MVNETSDCNVPKDINYVGPVETFELLGWWSISMFSILAIHLLPVWIYTFISIWRISRARYSAVNFPSHLYLACVPFLLVTVTALGMIFPFIGKYSETLLEVVITMAMLQYIRFVITGRGGSRMLAQYCRDHEIPFNTGSAPFVCFMICTKPAPSPMKLALAKWGPVFLFCVKVSILSVDIIFLLLDYHQSGWYLDVDNIHYILSIPAGLIGIYCYNIFIGIFNEVLKNDTRRFMGPVLLMIFILFDVLRLFFVFLVGAEMLSCLPPYYNTYIVEHLLKNIIKAFLATWIGMFFLKCCSDVKDFVQESEANNNDDAIVGDSEDTDKVVSINKAFVAELNDVVEVRNTK